MNEVTRILRRSEAEGTGAAEALLPLVYEELRNLARARMSRELPQHTLQATALVHEAWLRLVGGEAKSWANRAQFFAAASEAMRRILIDHARRRRAQRRGGGVAHERVDDFEIAASEPDDELLAVDAALDALARHDATKAELVKLKYFAGLSTEEAADVLNLSLATARRHWDYARAWLFREVARARALE
ncbi:MAG: sigma-70 family RNA polymerase sigma factor [Verrucomicrobia bacterium]|nr:sigma-70 family RNA polymerase sigma factor [Verrucomicrobiota bacterium]MBI3867223.1 sigma-70 family RNA polymerase sigma factor [Verrucomicrobiota bacterium]